MNDFLINALGYEQRARIIFGEMSKLVSALPKEQVEFIGTLCLMAGPIDANEHIHVKMAGHSQGLQLTGSLDGVGIVCGHIIKNANTPSCITTVRRNKYTGITEAPYESAAQNIEYYYRMSEQLPTMIRLFNAHGITRGVMLQLLPGEDKAIFSNFTKRLKEVDSYFLAPENTISFSELKKHILPDLLFMETKSLRYHCACSREMYYGLIFALTPSDVDEIIKSKDTLHAQCSLCGKDYSFTYREIAGLYGVSAIGS